MKNRVQWVVREEERACSSDNSSKGQSLDSFWEDILEETRFHVGGICPICNFEIMEISKDSLNKCKMNSPEFKSVPKSLLKACKDYTPICPKCDAYALGMEMEKGIPFRDVHGLIKTVHDLEDLF